MFQYLWLILSFTSSLFNTTYTLSSKGALEYIEPTSFTAYILLFSLIITIIITLFSKSKFIFSFYSLLVGITAGITFLFFNKSIEKSANPGLVMAVYRSQAMLTFILSIFIFKLKFHKRNFFGVSLVIIGVFIISSIKKERFITKKKRKSHNWVFYAILGGIFATLNDIFLKKAFQNKNLKMPVFLLHQMFFGSIILFIYLFVKNKSIKLESNQELGKNKIIKHNENSSKQDSGGNKIKKYMEDKTNKNIKKYVHVLIVSIIFLSYVGTLNKATYLAPNPGMAKAIDILGILITLFVSKYIFKGSAINKKQWFGSIILVIGIGLISI
jgi:drug/metabolite transporter (DMT)-like permease